MSKVDKVLLNIFEYKNLLLFLNKNHPQVLEECKNFLCEQFGQDTFEFTESDLLKKVCESNRQVDRYVKSGVAKNNYFDKSNNKKARYILERLRIVPVYELQKEASIKDVVEIVDNPFETIRNDIFFGLRKNPTGYLLL